MKQNIPNIVVSASDSQALKEAARINSQAYFKAGVPDEVTIRRSDYLHVKQYEKSGLSLPDVDDLFKILYKTRQNQSN